MAAFELARKLARGEQTAAGTIACMNRLRLAEFEPELSLWGMVANTIDKVIDHGASTL